MSQLQHWLAAVAMGSGFWAGGWVVWRRRSRTSALARRNLYMWGRWPGRCARPAFGVHHGRGFVDVALVVQHLQHAPEPVPSAAGARAMSAGPVTTRADSGLSWTR